MLLIPRFTALQSKLECLKERASLSGLDAAERALRLENLRLHQEDTMLAEKLRALETLFGILQYRIPTVSHSCGLLEDGSSNLATVTHKESRPRQQTLSLPQSETKSEKKPGAAKSSSASNPVKSAHFRDLLNSKDTYACFGRLDIRVGRILEVTRHPDADSLYIEKVDFGEGRLRTVISGLVKFVPTEALQGQLGVFLCNLKPAKMLGVQSEAMLLCAVAPDAGRVEQLTLDSAEVLVGDTVALADVTYAPDKQLNPKKKIWEHVKTILKVDEDGFATCGGVRWTLQHSPAVFVNAATLRNVPIS